MQKNKPCACCGKETLPPNSVFEICPVCGWEDDDIQNEHPDFGGGANIMSLNQAKEAYKHGKTVK